MTAPREIDKSDQRARRAMWEDFFTRRCPTRQDVINSAVGALVLRDAQIADLEARVRELRTEITRLEVAIMLGSTLGRACIAAAAALGRWPGGEA